MATYEYDLNGNRTRLTTSSGVLTGTYDAQDRLSSYGGATYGYTGAGELQTKVVGSDTTRYSYDVFGNLTQVRLPDGTQLDYVVDAQNRRIGKRVNGTLVRGFLYQGQLAPVAELDGQNQVVSRFVYGTRINVPDYLVKGGATYRLVTDHLGSVRLVVNVADGAAVQQLDYDEFGRVTQNTNPGFQPFGYAGGLYDDQTVLVRFGARDYDAQSGRWTAKDPTGFAGGDPNLYAYVANDPVTYTDPTGLRPLSECEKDRLKPYIPQEDLDNADLHPDKVPWYLPKKYIGITRGNDIYFRPGVYDPSLPGGLALLGHELVHVGQYREGETGLSFLWSYRNGYENSPLEKPADELQARIQEELSKSGCACNP